MLDKAVLKQASEIFAKDLFDYAKTGGDMKSIKLKNVYDSNILSKNTELVKLFVICVC